MMMIASWFQPGRRQLLALLLLLALVRGSIYAGTVPLWQAPDEAAHFLYARLMLDRGLRPSAAEDVPASHKREILAAMTQSGFERYQPLVIPRASFLSHTPEIPGPSQRVHPPLYYAIAALWLWPLSHQEIIFQAAWLRELSVALAALVILLAYLTGRELFPDNDLLALALPATIMLIPAHTFITSTINSDILAELLVSTFVLVWIRAFRRGLTAGRGAAIILLMILGLWIKRTTVVTLPLSVLALAIYFRHRWPRPRSRAAYALLVGLCCAVLLLAAACLQRQPLALANEPAATGAGNLAWDLRPWCYAVMNDVLGLRVSHEAVQSLLDLRRSWTFRAIYRWEAQNLVATFWASFGTRTVTVHPVWIALVALVTLLAGARGVIFLARRQIWQADPVPGQRRALVFCLVFAALTVLVTFLRVHPLQPGSFIPHARYIYIAVIPMTAFALWGGLHRTSPRTRSVLLATWLSGLFLLDAAALLYYILPFYYGGPRLPWL